MFEYVRAERGAALKVAARALALAAAVAMTAACAHMQANHKSGAGSNPEVPLTSEGPGTKHDLSDAGDDLDAIPGEVNRLVLQWIDYFQGRGREHMERYLSRSTRYLPLMKGILKKEGLPEDLVYIALIESGFNPVAHSSASAVGFWQFIRPTGKRYGLEVNSYVDDRRDFVKSTVAAADYFKGLYNLFGSWYLAIASYNVGENRVKNVVMKYHTRDFWALARDGKLPSETINYVPKFLAARLIAKSPEKYGFGEVEYQPALAFAEVDVNRSVDLRKFAEGLGVDADDVRDLNPGYKKGVAFAKSGRLKLRVPVGSESKAVAAAEQAAAQSPRTYASVSDDDVTVYRVRRGDTLSSIARRFGTTAKRLRALNSGRVRLIAGHKVKVPDSAIGGLAMEELSAQRSPSRYSPGGAKKNSRGPQGSRIHIVRRGDSLAQIARKYRVNLGELARRNALRHKGIVAIGTRLEIPE